MENFSSPQDRCLLVNSNGPTTATRNTPVPSACINCRSKHQKCNGGNPCVRCCSEGLHCSYLKSRRGYKGPRRAICSDISVSSNVNNPGMLSEGMASPVSWSSPNPASVLAMEKKDKDVCNSATESSLTLAQYKSSVDNIKLRCIEAYYFNFHSSHPFILSKAHLLTYTKRKPLPLLSAAIRYIGSRYLSDVPTAPILAEAEDILLSTSNDIKSRDGFRVQAILLLAIGLDGEREITRSSQHLDSAANLAIELGMQHEVFPSQNNEGCTFLEESWRRTFWEIYVVDRMMSGMHQTPYLRLHNISPTVRLPCEEKQYETGLIPPSPSLEDFDEVSFVSEEIQYSSFVYRIAAVRNLEKILTISPHISPDDPTIAVADTILINWKLHLPISKNNFIDEDGRVDKMMFQAHMVTNVSILLHQQYANLNTSVTRSITSCAPNAEHRGSNNIVNINNVHTAKVIFAAEELTKMIRLPTSIIQHTPFFTCASVLACIIHLSSWSCLSPLMSDDDIKSLLKLNTGALKKIASVWPNAELALEHIQGVAQNFLVEKKRAYAYWNSLMEEEVMRTMINEEGVMEMCNR